MMEKVENALQWGAFGALSCGGFLIGLSMTTSHDVRHLSKLPVVRELADIQQLETRGSLSGRQVAATGIVKSKEHLTDTISGRPALASLIKGVETHRTRVRHGWEEGERPIKEVRRWVPLSLELQNKHEIDLRPSAPKDFNPVLEHSVTVSHPTQNNLLQALLETSVGYVVTGCAEQEYLLPPDTEITAIGELTKEATLKGEQYSLQPHLGQFSVSRRSVDQQIQQLERWSKGLKTAALVFGATGLVFASIAYALKGYRFYRRKKRLFQKPRNQTYPMNPESLVQSTRKQEKEFLKREAARTEGRRSAAQDGGEGDRNRRWHCIVCWETDVNQTVFPECGHIAVCTRCATHLVRCPICRRTSVPRQIYYS